MGSRRFLTLFRARVRTIPGCAAQPWLSDGGPCRLRSRISSERLRNHQRQAWTNHITAISKHYFPSSCAGSPWFTCWSSSTSPPERHHTTYSVLDDPRNVWSFRSPHYDGDATDSDSEDEFDRNEEAALRPSISHRSMSIVAVDKPRGQVTVVVLEEAAVLAQLGVHIAIFMTNAWGKHGKIAAIANIAVWTYIATLASLRLLFSSTSKLSFPGLWYHTAFIYGFQWLFTVLLFRSAIIHPRSDVHQKLMISQFALVSLLFLIALCSRKGNKTVELEYEGDIAPAREPTASVFSLATFSWVDPIVWTG